MRIYSIEACDRDHGESAKYPRAMVLGDVSNGSFLPLWVADTPVSTHSRIGWGYLISVIKTSSTAAAHPAAPGWGAMVRLAWSSVILGPFGPGTRIA